MNLEEKFLYPSAQARGRGRQGSTRPCSHHETKRLVSDIMEMTRREGSSGRRCPRRGSDPPRQRRKTAELLRDARGLGGWQDRPRRDPAKCRAAGAICLGWWLGRSGTRFDVDLRGTCRRAPAAIRVNSRRRTLAELRRRGYEWAALVCGPRKIVEIRRPMPVQTSAEPTPSRGAVQGRPCRSRGRSGIRRGRSPDVNRNAIHFSW